jgi:hypothetical protein
MGCIAQSYQSSIWYAGLSQIVGLTVRRITGWKPMLQYAVASPLLVHGDNFRDGPENGSTVRKTSVAQASSRVLLHYSSGVSHRSRMRKKDRVTFGRALEPLRGGRPPASYRFRFSEDFWVGVRIG